MTQCNYSGSIPLDLRPLPHNMRNFFTIFNTHTHAFSSNNTHTHTLAFNATTHTHGYTNTQRCNEQQHYAQVSQTQKHTTHICSYNKISNIEKSNPYAQTPPFVNAAPRWVDHESWPSCIFTATSKHHLESYMSKFQLASRL